jgi:hypothetical protein
VVWGLKPAAALRVLWLEATAVHGNQEVQVGGENVLGTYRSSVSACANAADHFRIFTQNGVNLNLVIKNIFACCTSAHTFYKTKSHSKFVDFNV